MKHSIIKGTLCSLLFAFGISEANAQPESNLQDEGPEHHLLFTTGSIDWQDAPPSLEEGGEIAVLEGNPGEAGVFTLRIKMPDGYYISPHSHPNVERVTVVSGNFLLGSGEELDEDATEKLEPGSYTSMPPGMVHYAIADGETVIQLTSVGPWVINYVHEEDDPRLRE
ncbi:MAG: cupin domain-containing protein [Balneolaceae bacterium]